MRKLIVIVFILLSLLLVSCTSGQNFDNSASELDKYAILKTTDEVTESDFVYRLVSEKDEYQENEAVKIYAELEYIGEKEEITIFHAASPFYFPIKEKVRNYDIGYGMEEPLVRTTLKHGEPIREEYVKSGGYSDQDEDDYVAFMKKFFNMNGFPIGYYVVDGYSDFYVENDEDSEEKDDFRIEGQIDFKVLE